MAEFEIEFKCKHCGKPITVLYPSRWGYKVRNKKGGWNYYCTWKCLRADERKEPKPEQAEELEEKDGRNNRLEVLEELLEAVKGGKDAYDFLEQMGYTDPKDTLRRLRITAKKEAPKLYTKMEKAGLLDMRKGRSGKGADNVNKLTREQKEKAVKLALEGGDYLDHLKKCGSKNPSAAWWYIKKTLAKSNPTLLAKVMKKTGEIEEIKAPENTEGGPVVEKADKQPPEADVPPPEFPGEEGLVIDQHSIRCNGHVIARNGPLPGTEQPEPEVNYPEVQEKVITIKAQDKLDGFRVKTIVGEFGEYTVQGKSKFFKFESMDQKTVIFMRSEDFIPFLDELQRAAQIMEVV